MSMTFPWFIALLLHMTFSASCALLGEACSRTVFYKCCHSTVCSLVYPFVGVCVPCFSKGTMCLNGDECCDASHESCSRVGSLCVWTPLNNCCDGLVCELQGPIYGRCEGCLSSGNFCVDHQQCCNSNCYYFACL
ncbi:hypothetical protein X801_00110 [Opisthorchis viverrini]|uniref:UPF0506 domain-containing protein n=1 Tax=Opisthorchis viverrini TaxID=6198 RepID=A0A1S8XB61_OPIVI|nr:hypothetical protein X801_00110 [Opisthorchis viverrini]